VDLAVSTPKQMVRVTIVRESPRLAKMVQHVPEQGGKIGVLQLIETEPSVGSEGGIGVVIHLSKNKGEMNQHFIHQIETINQNSK
jgi:hypothetical protein